MRQFSVTLVLLLLYKLSFSQYYLRGELKDEKGQGLQGARIALFSKGTYPYYTGASGAFGIPTNLKVDTITFSLEGYDTLKTAVVTKHVGSFTLKMTNRKAASTTVYLSSFTKNLHFNHTEPTRDDGETYSSTLENPIVNAKDNPETGFALHIDKASYSNIRRFLNLKEKPPPDAVRIEEMLNYFNFKIKPESNQQKTFVFNSNITPCAWNPKNQLLFINLQARKINLDKTPPANLVFLIDVSGSMDTPNRLPLLKSAFKLLVENLRSKDFVSIVTYGDQVKILLQPTSGDRKQKIIESIEGLFPDGATPGASAIKTAYSVARGNFIVNGNNRVILATDGDFNVGQSSEKELEEIITRESKTGIYLTCLGVGVGNYKDSKLETLAKKGKGNFAYLDNEKEAEKVLVEEFAQTLYTIASNVFLNVRFNADLVKEYRLIGFDNKKTAIGDKNTELEGGEVGSGHSLLAAFEITPLENSISPSASSSEQNIASVQLSYKLADNVDTVKEVYESKQNLLPLNKCDSALRFASAIIMFGTLLKQSPYSKEFTWDQLNSLASASANPKNLLHKEFIELISKGKKVYTKKRKID
ncbi:MAG: von Willebrand factor type [Segetibacter sp.]|nr:von Willebrand factor type [Segetibacter sp.]